MTFLVVFFSVDKYGLLVLYFISFVCEGDDIGHTSKEVSGGIFPSQRLLCKAGLSLPIGSRSLFLIGLLAWPQYYCDSYKAVRVRPWACTPTPDKGCWLLNSCSRKPRHHVSWLAAAESLQKSQSHVEAKSLSPYGEEVQRSPHFANLPHGVTRQD